MNAILRPVVSVMRFLYHFAVGDDWVVAAALLLALVATAVLATRGVNAWWLVPSLALMMTWVSLRRRVVS